MKRLLLCSCAALSLFATEAKASPLFELSGDTLGTGGFQGRTRASGSAASYFNPSLLTEAEQGFELSEFFVYDHIRTILDGRPSSVDIPELAADNFGGAQPSLPTSWLENGCEPTTSTCSTDVPARPRGGDTSSGEFRAYQGIGLVNHVWPDLLTLGFYTLVPIGAFTTGHSFFVDEREQYFTNSLHPELFSDRLTAISLSFAVAVRVFKQLSLGMSATLSLKNDADANTFTGDPDDVHNSIELSTKLKVLNSISPHGGVTYTPLDWLRIAATVHSPQKTEIVTKFANLLPTGDYQWAERTAVLSYVPWIVGLGGEARVLKAGDVHTLGVSGLVTYERWSQYRNRQDQHPHGRYEWSDTFVYVLGTRHTYRERLTSFLDLSYRPSPVPAQTGRTNYVDNDRWSGDLGMQWLFPLQRHRIALRFGAQAQLHYLPERHHTKDDPLGDGEQLVRDEWADDTIDRTQNPAVPYPEAEGLQTNNPGYPGYGSDGWVMGGGINMAVLY